MKYLLVALVSGALVALAFGMSNMDSTGEVEVESSSAVMSFSSEDGQATATLVCEDFLPGSMEGLTPRSFRLFGAYMDPELDMVGSALQSFGTSQGTGASADQGKTISLDLGAWRFRVTPNQGDWAGVQTESDVTAVFEPVTQD